MSGCRSRVLVVGWFSYELHGATAGDLLARDLVRRWLSEAGVPHDVVTATPFEAGLRWGDVDALAYSDVVFVCGPFGNGPPIVELLDRFEHCRLHGINLTMLQPLEEWNPFWSLLERDSSRAAQPDLVFLTNEPQVPVVGLVLVHQQQEYASRARHRRVDALVRSVLETKGWVVVPIDTRLDVNSTGLATPAQVESLIARMDVVVTTRLHGTVLALKNGVPVVPIDPVAGGAKVTDQVRAIGWPMLLSAEALDPAALSRALDQCFEPDMRERASACARQAQTALRSVRSRFLSGLMEIT